MSKQGFSLEAAMKELVEIEEYFDKAEFNLEEGIKLHSRAKELAKQINSYLTELEGKIEVLEQKDVE